MKKGIIIFGVLALSSLNSTWGQIRVITQV